MPRFWEVEVRQATGFSHCVVLLLFDSRSLKPEARNQFSLGITYRQLPPEFAYFENRSSHPLFPFKSCIPINKVLFVNCVFDTILLFPRSTTGLGWLVDTISLPCKHHHRHRQLPLRFQTTTCSLISASSFWSLHNHEVNFCLQSRPYLHSPPPCDI